MIDECRLMTRRCPRCRRFLCDSSHMHVPGRPRDAASPKGQRSQLAARVRNVVCDPVEPLSTSAPCVVAETIAPPGTNTQQGYPYLRCDPSAPTRTQGQLLLRPDPPPDRTPQQVPCAALVPHAKQSPRTRDGLEGLTSLLLRLLHLLEQFTTRTRHKSFGQPRASKSRTSKLQVHGPKGRTRNA